MAQHESSSATLRLTLLTLVVAGMFAALFSRLWFLQVLAGERYAELAESNRVRWVITEAPRGRIFDRDGVAVVKNRPALTISAYPQRLLDEEGTAQGPEATAVLDRLSSLLEMPREQIVERLTSRKYSPFRAVPVKEDVTPEVFFQVKEHRELFAGVEAERLPVRSYPHGIAAAHVVGYIGEISDQELASERYEGYRLGDLIGKAGLEHAYELDLQGDEGLKQLEVNASGTVLGVLAERDPAPGDDLVTTIDLDLQKEVERLLYEGIVESRSAVHRGSGQNLTSIAGSAVVMDPRDGSVLAMASWPTYDPTLFVDGVSPEEYQTLYEATPVPALNLAIQGQYAPGSTWKIVSGAAALQAGQITPQSRLACPPRLRVGSRTFRNWSSRHEGSMDLALALKRSCDTFFYKLAFDHWLAEERQEDDGQPVHEVYQDMAGQFGFGAPLGVDLPGEKPGRVPDREWKQAFWEANRERTCRQAQESAPGTYPQRLYSELCTEGFVWRGGDAVNMSIGQGDVLVTPLQLASAFATVANGGTVWRPHLGARVVSPEGETVSTYHPEAVGQVAFAPDHLAEIRAGLEMVVMADRGTAAHVFRTFPLSRIPVAGKTGTAEVGGKLPSAWFVAYAPANDPQYVVVVQVEEGGGGSQTAAPIVRRILEAIFELPVSPFRTAAATD